ncbi:MAG: hemerythrin domain-containing protein [Verrucomicrobia bacterium]|jgi:hemerythrin-like domain-containing protein|nr:hemerythrin domain-containing protein [Verrucomicrobiota bacterium]
MSTITKALVMEHAVFCAVFDQIERVCPRMGTAQEVKLLAAVVEGLLNGHAETEKNLAYSALDHVLKDDDRLNRLHQDHHEIDEHFHCVQRVNDPAEAQRLLRKALAATREHFRREEQIVFPFLERVLQAETLAALGETWMSSYLASAKRETPATIAG